jgi:hypothetical protein
MEIRFPVIPITDERGRVGSVVREQGAGNRKHGKEIRLGWVNNCPIHPGKKHRDGSGTELQSRVRGNETFVALLGGVVVVMMVTVMVVGGGIGRSYGSGQHKQSNGC